MTNNGVVLPDLRWKPVAYEIKQAYAPVTVRPVEKLTPWLAYNWAGGKYEVLNHSFTRPISDYTITMILREDGKAVYTKAVDPGGIAPLSMTTLEWKPEYAMKDECEYHIEFTVTLNETTSYSEAGYEVGRSQYLLASPKKAAVCAGKPTAGSAVICETAGAFHLSAAGTEVTVCKTSGAVSIAKDGIARVQSGGLPALDKPYTGVDANPDWGGMASTYEAFRKGNSGVAVESVTAQTSGDKAVAAVIFKITAKRDGMTMESLMENRYTLSANGVLEVDMFYDLSRELAYVARAGMQFVLPKGYEKLTYYGMGGNENYSDRLLSAYMGVFEETVSGQHFPFGPPSECGGHEQVRWLTVTDETGHTVSFTSVTPFHFDAHRNTVEDYQNASHDHLLPKRGETYIHIDAAHSGIGSDMAWSSAVVPEHLVAAGTWHLRFCVCVD
jgi:beta-galactosidase